MTMGRFGRERVVAAAWGAFFMASVGVLIVAGSRNLGHFDPALVAYTFATLFNLLGSDRVLPALREAGAPVLGIIRGCQDIIGTLIFVFSLGYYFHYHVSGNGESVAAAYAADVQKAREQEAKKSLGEPVVRAGAMQAMRWYFLEAVPGALALLPLLLLRMIYGDPMKGGRGFFAFGQHYALNRIEDFGTHHPNLSFDVTGPWPPYDFVRIVV